MDPEKIKAALEAIKAGDADAALALLEEMVAAAAGAGDGGTEGDGTEGEPGALAEGADPPEEDPEEAAATTRALKLLTGCKSGGEAIKMFTTVLKRVDRLDEEREALELSSRRELIADLVHLGAEHPSTAWEGDPKDRKPVQRLMGEPIDDLRKRVELLKQHRAGGNVLPIRPPASGASPDAVQRLSKKQLDWCKKNDISPEELVERMSKAVRRHGS